MILLRVAGLHAARLAVVLHGVAKILQEGVGNLRVRR